ncbi:hypothetical protein BSPWISOXPB_9326 [uncultured Gammaproteobacteria bacterium]|nr:hypothetical protein BSPWISOXPB_9326 [uncultured Gammaproteobacteria bacterium]
MLTFSYFNRAYTVYDYQDLVRSSLSYLNTISNFVLVLFAHKLADKYQSLPDYDADHPHAISPQRIRERGFNQVLELLSVIKRNRSDD